MILKILLVAAAIFFLFIISLPTILKWAGRRVMTDVSKKIKAEAEMMQQQFGQQYGGPEEERPEGEVRVENPNHANSNRSTNPANTAAKKVETKFDDDYIDFEEIKD